MSKGRTIASSVTLAVLIGLVRRLRRQLEVVHRRAERTYSAGQDLDRGRRREAPPAGVPRQLRKAGAWRGGKPRSRPGCARTVAARLASTTTTAPTASTTPTTGAPTPSTTTQPPDPPPSMPPAANPGDDLAAIQGALEDLNAAFRASVAAGITHVRDGELLGRHRRVHGSAVRRVRGRAGRRRRSASRSRCSPARSGPTRAGSIRWSVRSPAAGSTAASSTNVQTLVTTGEKRTVTVPLHVTVRPDGQRPVPPLRSASSAT